MHEDGGPARSHTTLRSLAVLGGCLAVFFALPGRESPSTAALVRTLVLMLAGVGVIALVITREFAGGRRYGRRLTAFSLIVMLELATLAFAAIYWSIDVNDPGEIAGLHTRLDALYFTMTTMTTVGYGDINAQGQLARGVVTAHLAFDLVFIAAFATLLRDRLAGKDDPTGR